MSNSEAEVGIPVGDLPGSAFVFSGLRSPAVAPFPAGPPGSPMTMWRTGSGQWRGSVTRLEREFASFLGARGALAVFSESEAMEAALAVEAVHWTRHGAADRPEGRHRLGSGPESLLE